MLFIYDDGGRSLAGFKGRTGDCACRAIAIAARLPYGEVYDALNAYAESERRGKRKRGISNSRTGVYRVTMHRYLTALGFAWRATMGIGTGCRVHLRDGELPSGRLVVSLSRHYAAVIDGTLRDAYDCSREGTRCVYGYWQIESLMPEISFGDRLNRKLAGFE